MPAVAIAGARALLLSLKSALVGGPIRTAVTGVTAGGLLDPFSFLGGGNGGGRRRRRKRALTASDKNDIAFIAATLGETTGRKFALLIAARS